MDKRISLMALSWMKLEFCKDSAKITKTEYTNGYRSHFHNHDFAQIMYCLKGSFTHTIGENSYTCNEGSVSIIAPGVFHSFNIPKGTILIYIDIAYNAFTNKSVKMHPSTVALCLLSCFYDSIEYFEFGHNRFRAESILNTLNDSDAISCKELFSMLEEFFAMILPTKDDSMAACIEKTYNTKLSPIIDALDYLNTHYAQKVHCDDILRTVLLCSTDFYNYFKMFIGTTYSIYLQMVRVSRAHRAIAFTPYSLSYIANMCGFCDNTYMTKCYKKFRGYTPSEERINLTRNTQKWKKLKISHDFFDV